MKKLLVFCLLAAVLAGCSNSAYKDNLAPYRHKTSRQLYQGAEKNMSSGDYAEAVKQLEALDAIYPFGAFAKKAQMDIIYAYYMNDDRVSAMVAADRYIHLYPQSKHVDYAYYMKGLVDFRQGMTWLQKAVGTDPSSRNMDNLYQAYAAFNQLALRFPQSKYRPNALRRMAYIRNLLAKHQTDVADYYFQRKAYVAALNRANEVIQHYQGAPQVVRALGIAVQSYQALGMKDKAHTYYEMLKKSYPDAKVLKTLQAA
jgi:outer membrane protein assembly factor BamD